MFVVYFDGASKGNPGPAGAGAAVYDAEGRVLADCWTWLEGDQTNNVAEYTGAITGLRQALTYLHPGETRVQLVGDSQLVIRQIEGLYRVRSPHLAQLFEEVWGLLRRFPGGFEVRHILREYNRRADALANQAVARRASGVIAVSPSDWLAR